MNEFLASVLSGINSVIGNYGWSMVVFTILIKALLIPMDYKSRKSMRRMSALAPQTAKLQKKYANDKEKLNQKTAELYRKEKINPMSGCVPMLISMPILFIMFAAMRIIANTELAKQAIDLLVTGVPTNESWLWVKNIWMPDSPFNAVIADAANLRLIPADIWAKVFTALQPDQIAKLATLNLNAATINGEAVFAALQNLPNYAQETALWGVMPSVNLIFFNLKIYANNNGWFILPILAAITQFLMTITQPQPATTPDANGQQAGMSKMMKYFFPLFSLYICSSYNAAFSLYWVVSNVFAWVEGIVLNKMFDAKEAAAEMSIGEGTLK
ncbi:MAG: YidC/Oxa1 family membrane protein insertase [Clostridia bacterium]